MTLDHIKSRQYKLQSETVRKRLEDIKKRPILVSETIRRDPRNPKNEPNPTSASSFIRHGKMLPVRFPTGDKIIKNRPLWAPGATRVQVEGVLGFFLGPLSTPTPLIGAIPGRTTCNTIRQHVVPLQYE